MIITITMNPSLDLIYLTEQFKVGKMNRLSAPVRYVGGKGINCGRTAAMSGSDVMLYGFLGGFFGDIVNTMLEKENRYNLHFLPVDEETRSAITVMHDEGMHTEIVEAGPYVKTELIFKLMEDLKKTCFDHDVSVITLNGSVNNKNSQIYVDIIRYIREEISKTIPVLLDISGKQLEEVLLNSLYKPNFIKPNNHEFSDLIKKRITSKSEIVNYLNKPLFFGVDVIMVSCGAEGAIVKIKEKIYDVIIPKIPVVNTTGSGDATVGGFAYSLEKKFSLLESIKYSMACGMSNSQQAEVGIIDRNDVLNFTSLIKTVEVKNNQIGL